MDFPGNSLCVKCDNGGKLLSCSENGCPLALHEACLGFPARLDDAGRFYCPYCLYKKAIAELHKARENASAKKKDLLIFMKGDVISSEKDMGEIKTCEHNGHDQLRNGDTNIHNISSPLGEEEKIGNAEEDCEASVGSKGQDPSSKVNGESGNRIAEENQVQQEGHESSSEEQMQEKENETSEEGEKTEEEESKTSVEEEETIQEDEYETSSSSTDHDCSPIVRTRAMRGCKRSKPADKDSEAVPVQTKLAEEEFPEEESETSSSSTNRDSPPVVPRAKRGCISSKPADKDSEAVPVQSKLAGKQIQEKERETSVEEETIQEDEYETSSSSTDHDSSYIVHKRAKRGCKSSKPAGKDSESVPVRRKLHKQHDEKQISLAVTPTWRYVTKSSLDERTRKVVKKELNPPRRARPYGGRCPAIKWTEEEEKVLREAVIRYLEQHANVSWKEILEENREKFHKTRTASALRHKWTREVKESKH